GRGLVLPGLVPETIDGDDHLALGVGQLEQIPRRGRGRGDVRRRGDFHGLVGRSAGGEQGGQHGQGSQPEGGTGGRAAHLPTWKVVSPPLCLSVVVMERKPLPRSEMEMVKLSVSSVPGMNCPSGPIILELAAVARRLMMARSSVSLKTSSDDLFSRAFCASSRSGLVCLLVASAEFSSTEPFRGLPPNDGLSG